MKTISSIVKTLVPNSKVSYSSGRGQQWFYLINTETGEYIQTNEINQSQLISDLNEMKNIKIFKMEKQLPMSTVTAYLICLFDKNDQLIQNTIYEHVKENQVYNFMMKVDNNFQTFDELENWFKRQGSFSLITK